MLKAPGSILLKLSHDGPLSSVAFKLNLRRYSMVAEGATFIDVGGQSTRPGATRAGAETRPLLSSTYTLLITQPQKPPSVSLKRCST